ncbi:MAG: UDP-N-acetylglucosamine 1-carboxyvinyltransferase [Cyanobacteria bacterium J06642_2]
MINTEVIQGTLGKQSVVSDQSEPVLRIWGKQPLSGHAPVSGAKNSALALMAGAILAPGTTRLRNVPRLVDIQNMGRILSSVGVKVTQPDGHTLDIDASHLTTSHAPYELVSKMRASFFITGPLLSRLGEARIPLPGGCAIGTRPVDLHVRGLQALGATVSIEHGVVHAYARKLRGARIYLDYPSVGATETLLMAATCAEGETTIDNAAREPEVIDLANLCRAMGARIAGVGTSTIVIEGVPQLHGTDYSVIPDRIEAGTLLIAGAITNSAITVGPLVPAHIQSLLAKLTEMGFRLEEVAPDCLRISPGAYRRAVDVQTLPYPGFPTDMQAQLMALMVVSEGDCTIEETVFENRMNHVPELHRMGADIKVKNGVAIVRGVPTLLGAPVSSTDLRAAAALVLAGLSAKGMTTVQALHHLDRGYEDIEGKLRALGAKIERFVPAASLTETPLREPGAK